jgi:hypothetical protein
MEHSIYTNCKYKALDGQNTAVIATINGDVASVPLSLDNRDYAEIMRQVEAGELTIAPADT